MFRRFLSYPTLLRIHYLQTEKVCPIHLQKKCLLYQKDGENFKNVSIAKTPSSSIPKDLLLEQLEHSSSISSVMDITSQHLSIMNNNHLAMVFKMLHKNIRSNSENIQIETISTNKDFMNLCKETLRKIRFFDCREVVTLIKTLAYLGIPQDTALYQAVCQMLRHYINDLDLNQLTFLDFILYKTSEETKRGGNPLVESLIMALPLVLQTQMQYQLDPENMEQLSECFSMAVKHNLKPALLEKVSQLLLDKKEELTISQTLKIYFPLTQYSLNQMGNNLSKLLNHIMSILPDIVEKLNLKLNLSILRSLQKNIFLANSKLLSVYSAKAVRERWNLKHFDMLLRVYVSAGFVSTEVLDLVAELMVEDQDSVMYDPGVSILTLVESFSLGDYLPGASNEFLKVILCAQNKLQKIERNRPHLLVKLVVHLAVFEVASPEIISRVLDRDFVNNVFQSVNSKVEKHLLQNYRLLEQVIRIEMPEYQGNFCPDYLLTKSVHDRAEVLQPLDVSLKDFLEIGLGGPQFLLNGLWTHYGHYIDHLVVMRKGDFPVAVNSGGEPKLVCPVREDGMRYVEDLVAPPDSKMLAVLVARHEWFTTDPQRLTGFISLQHRTLRKLGYNPILLGPPIISEGGNQDLMGHLDNDMF